MQNKTDDFLPTEKDIENYLLLKDLLKAQRHEYNILSNKKWGDQLNKFKIKIINRILEPLYELFKNEPTHNFLDIPNEDDLPSNSDVVLIISQYETAINEFRDKYFIKDGGLPNWYWWFKERWNTKENPILGKYIDSFQ